MGRRKNETTRSLNKTGRGRTYSVSIPIEMIRKLGWREKQKVVFRLRGKTISIKDWPVKSKKLK